MFKTCNSLVLDGFCADIASVFMFFRFNEIFYFSFFLSSKYRVAKFLGGQERD